MQLKVYGDAFMDKATPNAFIWRRLHSLFGVFLVLFLIEHLLTNSQAALWIGDDGIGFIESVNWIHNLPYLPVIEVSILLVPFLVHGLFGIKYLFTSKSNVYPTDGTKSALGRYERNWGYTLQRLTSWVLVVAVIAHVAQMRFIEYPEAMGRGLNKEYVVRVTEDAGLPSVSERLKVKIAKELNVEKSLLEGQVYAIAPDFGTASLLVVRDTFKSPLMIVLYSFFVIFATYHAFNGLWTSFITWGVNLTQRSQRAFLKISYLLMGVVMFLGLAAAIGTYWFNLRS